MTRRAAAHQHQAGCRQRRGCGLAYRGQRATAPQRVTRPARQALAAYFYPPAVEWAVLALIRIGLGDRAVRHPTSALRMSEAFLSKIEAAARRVPAAFGETQAKLLLHYR